MPQPAGAKIMSITTMVGWVAVVLAAVLDSVAADDVKESDGTAELLATLIPAATTAGVMTAVFLIARPLYPNVYAPRANWLKSACGHIKLPEGLTQTVRFFLTIYHVPEREVIEKVGCDATIFLRVFKMGLILFSTCSVTAIMLLAVNSTAENNLSGLIGLSMSNIADESNRMWAHVVGMWLNSLIVYYTLWKNYREILLITQEFKATKMANYSVLVRSIPVDLRGDSNLFDYFEAMYPGKVYAATSSRDVGTLTDKVADFREAVLELTRTQIAYDELCAKATADKPAKRPLMRPLALNLKGVKSGMKNLGKVDALVYLTEKRDALRAEIEELRATPKKEYSQSGFVTFNSVVAASSAAQVLHAMVPATVDVDLAPEAREVYWPGVVMSPLLRTAGMHTVTLLKIPLSWGYIVAILFIATLQNLETLTNTPGFGWVGSLPDSVKGIVQGLVPVILLSVLMAILPMILRKFAERAGEPSESAIQEYVFGTHYLYQVIFVFFLTTLSAAIFSSLNDIANEPLTIFKLLGETVPDAGGFFLSYVLLQAFGRFPAQLARIGPLILSKWFLRNEKVDAEKINAMEPGMMDYGELLPRQLIIYLLCLAYANLQPIISFFGVAYFAMGYVTWKHQLLMVYTKRNESGGTMWHRIFKFILVGVGISQGTLIGVMAAKKGILMGPFLIPLPIITYMFFNHFDKHYATTVSSKIVAREISALVDSTNGELSDEELEKMASAYKQPELIYNLDDILYHTTLRCTTSECLSQPPPIETWHLDDVNKSAWSQFTGVIGGPLNPFRSRSDQSRVTNEEDSGDELPTTTRETHGRFTRSSAIYMEDGTPRRETFHIEISKV
eukprot:m.35962 g.35962  ORF g.35962 m.35962 type:complete len:846 (+) comp12824_c0_seq4:140-2677(+)